MPSSDSQVVLCPHKGCNRIIRLRSAIPDGNYVCLCNLCDVQIAREKSGDGEITLSATCMCWDSSERSADAHGV